VILLAVSELMPAWLPGWMIESVDRLQHEWTWLGWTALILVLLLTFFYAVLILIYRWAWVKMPVFEPEKNKQLSAPEIKVSVIIPARNEVGRIGHCISAVLAQQYPAALLEIIVINDHSTDQTAEEVLNSGDSRVKLINLEEVLKGEVSGQAFKKKAIEIGVQAASGSLILTTDADTRPGSQWLNRMVGFYNKHGFKMISGPVSIYPSSGLLGKWQELDLLSLVGIGAASIQLGYYNICNGANLAYEKEAFEAVGGFRDIDDQPSGDDMLLMHKMGKKYPGQIGFLKDPLAVVSTFSAESLGELWDQRTRWASKSTRYEDFRITLILIAVWLFNLSIPVSMALGAVDGIWFRIGLLAFLVKIVVDTLFQAPLAGFFHKRGLLWSFLPIQILHIAYVVIMGPWSTFASYSWKGRDVKSAASRFN
jgi:cellulose synthase/poly-beta-1,6-N-acetylglucosamine synthase-like glycosyltransferase